MVQTPNSIAGHVCGHFCPLLARLPIPRTPSRLFFGKKTHVCPLSRGVCCQGQTRRRNSVQPSLAPKVHQGQLSKDVEGVTIEGIYDIYQWQLHDPRLIESLIREALPRLFYSSTHPSPVLRVHYPPSHQIPWPCSICAVSKIGRAHV